MEGEGPTAVYNGSKQKQQTIVPKTQAVGMHSAPLHYKPGMIRQWVEEDNEGVQIVGIKWLLKRTSGEVNILPGHLYESGRGGRKIKDGQPHNKV